MSYYDMKNPIQEGFGYTTQFDHKQFNLKNIISSVEEISIEEDDFDERCNEECIKECNEDYILSEKQGHLYIVHNTKEYSNLSRNYKNIFYPIEIPPPEKTLPRA